MDIGALWTSTNRQRRRRRSRGADLASRARCSSSPVEELLDVCFEPLCLWISEIYTSKVLTGGQKYIVEKSEYEIMF